MVNFQTRGSDRKQSLTMHLIHLCSWLCSACVKPLEDCMWSFTIVNLQRGMISLNHLMYCYGGLLYNSLKQKQFCRSSSSQVSLFNIQEGEIQHLASKKTNLLSNNGNFFASETRKWSWDTCMAFTIFIFWV
jgi:hypothetical protein